ncbi:hypothetical protein Tco_0316310 [Tanacetum coccineum]
MDRRRPSIKFDSSEANLMLPFNEGTPKMGSARFPSEMRKATIKHVGDGGRRDKAILHKLCILDGLLDVLLKVVKLIKILWNLVSSHEWLGLSTQPTPREKVKALGANGDVSGSRVGVVWMEVGGGLVRARVVSRVVVGVMQVVLVVLRGWEVFVRWFWMGELSLEEMLMKLVEVGSCKEWDQDCSCLQDHSLGEELEKVNWMTRSWKELELGDEAFSLILESEDSFLRKRDHHVIYKIEFI